MDNNEVIEENEVCDTENISVPQIVKRLTTPNSEINTTFKGEQVIGYSLEPEGVVKALIDTTSGIISFEKYDEEWYGEIHLSLQTESGENEQYNSDYTVCFEEQVEEIEEVEEDFVDVEDDIEILSDEDNEETFGGASAYGAGVPGNVNRKVNKGTTTLTFTRASTSKTIKCFPTGARNKNHSRSGAIKKCVLSGSSLRITVSSTSKTGNVGTVNYSYNLNGYYCYGKIAVKFSNTVGGGASSRR